MKKFLLILSILILTLTSVYSQTNIYHPFPTSNAFWGDDGWNVFNSDIHNNTRYGINGDTIISAKNYKKIYSLLYDSTFTNPNSTYFAAIREQNKKVYTVIGNNPETILYDFNLSVSDTITYNSLFSTGIDALFSRVVTKVDSILLLNGKYRKRWAFAPVLPTSSTSDTVVEGIGSIIWRGLFNPLIPNICTCGNEWRFACFKQNDTVLYLDNPKCNHCFCSLWTSVNKVEEQKRNLFYPNPFSTETTLQADNPFNDATLTMYNLSGQQVKQIKNISGNTITLHRDNLPRGIYFLQLIQGNKTFSAAKIEITDY
jgi:hypothetical protein